MLYWIFYVWISVFALSNASDEHVNKQDMDMYWIRIPVRKIVTANLTTYPYFKALKPFPCAVKCRKYPKTTLVTLTSLLSLSMIINLSLLTIFFVRKINFSSFRSCLNV